MALPLAHILINLGILALLRPKLPRPFVTYPLVACAGLWVDLDHVLPFAFHAWFVALGFPLFIGLTIALLAPGSDLARAIASICGALAFLGGAHIVTDLAYGGAKPLLAPFSNATFAVSDLPTIWFTPLLNLSPTEVTIGALILALPVMGWCLRILGGHGLPVHRTDERSMPATFGIAPGPLRPVTAVPDGL